MHRTLLGAAVILALGVGPSTALAQAPTVTRYYIYDVGFKFWDQAYAAALTLVLLVILAAVALGQFLLLDRRVHYQ